MIWLLAGVACAALGLYGFTVGVIVGCGIHWHASIFYRRNLDDEVSRIKEKAYADHLTKLEEEAAKGKVQASDELANVDRDEGQASFEASLAVLYPNDPLIQEKLKKERAARLSTSGIQSP